MLFYNLNKYTINPFPFKCYCFKIGIIGLVEKEWITTLSTINHDEIIYESYEQAGARLSKELKTEDVGAFFYV